MNDEAKKMAQLLRSGNTMLNQACPVCNNPIFRNKDGKVFCPICNREVMFVNADNEKDFKNKEEITKKIQDKDSIYSLKEIILEKIEWIAQKLKSETQIDNIERYVILLTNFLDLFKTSENLKL